MKSVEAKFNGTPDQTHPINLGNKSFMQQARPNLTFPPGGGGGGAGAPGGGGGGGGGIVAPL